MQLLSSFCFGQHEQTKFSFSVESGIHMDINNLLYPSYVDDRPPFVPDEFEYQKVLTGWNNRIAINYHLKKGYTLTARVGYTTFKRAYEKSGTDIYGFFEGEYYFERYAPVDVLLSKEFYLSKSASSIIVGFGPIIRFFDDSALSYGLVYNAKGELYIPGVYTLSRSFGDIGWSFNLSYEKALNTFTKCGVNLNAYTLYGGYGLESVILAPYINVKF
jgi:hypothetical protein